MWVRGLKQTKLILSIMSTKRSFFKDFRPEKVTPWDKQNALSIIKGYHYYHFWLPAALLPSEPTSDIKLQFCILSQLIDLAVRSMPIPALYRALARLNNDDCIGYMHGVIARRISLIEDFDQKQLELWPTR